MPHIRSIASGRLALPTSTHFAKAGVTTVLFGLLYFATALYSLKLLAPPAGVALFWPAAGLAAGLLIALGRPLIVPVVIGTLAATLAANIISGKSPVIGIGFGIANAAEALTIAYLTSFRRDEPFRLAAFSDVVTFFLASAAGTALSATIATAITAMQAPSAHNYFLEAWTWARADFVGVIAVAPIIIVSRAITLTRAPLSQHLLAVLLVVATGLLAHMIFTARIEGLGAIPSAALFIPLIALAFLTPSFYCAIGSTLVCSIIVVTIIAQLSDGQQGPDKVQSIISYAQMSIISVAGGSLSLAALIGELRRVEDELAVQASHSELLLREVTHRCKNLLAVVLSMARLAPRGGSVEEFVASYTARVMAMGGSMDLLIKESWQTVDLKDLLRVHIGDLGGISANRFRVEGAPLPLKPDVAQALGMAFYELFTNASKYGALSNDSGTVSLSWSVFDAASIPSVRLIWQERGGNGATPPAKSGFGTSVLRRVAPSTVNGEAELLYEPEGFTWILNGPMDGFSPVPGQNAPFDDVYMVSGGRRANGQNSGRNLV